MAYHTRDEHRRHNVRESLSTEDSLWLVSLLVAASDLTGTSNVSRRALLITAPDSPVSLRAIVTRVSFWGQHSGCAGPGKFEEWNQLWSLRCTSIGTEVSVSFSLTDWKDCGSLRLFSTLLQGIALSSRRNLKRFALNHLSVPIPTIQ